MSDLNPIIEKLRSFVKERDWDQFHIPKDLAMAISIESGELLEQFLWKNQAEINIDKIEPEIADIIMYCLLLADKLDIDVIAAMHDKIDVNGRKYPVAKAKGNAKKWKELDK